MSSLERGNRRKSPDLPKILISPSLQKAAISGDKINSNNTKYPPNQKTTPQALPRISQIHTTGETINLDAIVSEIEDGAEIDVKNLELQATNEPVLETIQIIPGTTIKSEYGPQYKITKKLGQGGMGTVYLATQQSSIETPVALKFAELNRENPNFSKFADLLIKEAKRANKLRHPNIARILSLEKYQGIPFAVFEYIPGKSIEDFMLMHRTKKKDIIAIRDDLVAFIAWQVLGGLAYAHENKTLHRDIKPANEIIDELGNVMILDLGIGGTQKSISRQIEKTGKVLGTPEYLPLELTMGKDLLSTYLKRMNGKSSHLDSNPVSGKSDVYMVATMMYEMLTGKLPNQIEKEMQYTLSNIVEMQMKKIVPPQDLVDGICPVIGNVVLEGLATDYRNRPSSQVMYQKLGQLLYPPGMGQGLFKTDLIAYMHALAEYVETGTISPIARTIETKINEAKRLRFEKYLRPRMGDRIKSIFSKGKSEKYEQDIFYQLTLNQEAQEKISQGKNPARQN